MTSRRLFISQAAALLTVLPVTVLRASDYPQVRVWKSPTCGCCSKWVDHLAAAGFDVEATNVNNMNAVKKEVGLPAALASCHTALVDGYVIEGHVPADDVKKLLAERPDVRGLAVPGMPLGSPGMEAPNPEAYDVLAFKKDGSTTVFTHHPVTARA